jgi:acylphosphatase
LREITAGVSSPCQAERLTWFLDFLAIRPYHILIDMTVRAHIVVLGMVQGVGFRWFTAREAQGLGLSGFVRNSGDGSVEVEAEGERGIVEELINRLKVGPRSADVQDLQIIWQEPLKERPRFEIR